MGRSSYTRDEDAQLSAGFQLAYRRGAASPTAEELEAEDERARQMIGTARDDLPTTWCGDDDE